MSVKDLQAQIALGEDSTRQFRAVVRNAESLTSEIAAFANSEGGTNYLGVANDGSTLGLDKSDIARINQHISNDANQLVKSQLKARTENGALMNGRIVIALTVPKGLDLIHDPESRKSVGKASVKILDAYRENQSITIPELAVLIGITERSVERNIQALKADGCLRRVGGRKEGHWEVVK